MTNDIAHFEIDIPMNERTRAYDRNSNAIYCDAFTALPKHTNQLCERHEFGFYRHCLNKYLKLYRFFSGLNQYSSIFKWYQNLLKHIKIDTGWKEKQNLKITKYCSVLHMLWILILSLFDSGFGRISSDIALLFWQLFYISTI